MAEKKKYSFIEKMAMTHPEKMEVGQVYHVLKVSDPYKYANKETGEELTGITVTTDNGDYYLPDTVVKSMIDGDFEENRKYLLNLASERALKLPRRSSMRILQNSIKKNKKKRTVIQLSHH